MSFLYACLSLELSPIIYRKNNFKRNEKKLSVCVYLTCHSAHFSQQLELHRNLKLSNPWTKTSFFNKYFENAKHTNHDYLPRIQLPRTNGFLFLVTKFLGCKIVRVESFLNRKSVVTYLLVETLTRVLLQIDTHVSVLDSGQE